VNRRSFFGKAAGLVAGVVAVKALPATTMPAPVSTRHSYYGQGKYVRFEPMAFSLSDADAKAFESAAKKLDAVAASLGQQAAQMQAEMFMKAHGQ
jgi:hypothetical protein